MATRSTIRRKKSKAGTKRPRDTMRDNYDFSGGVRGKYFERLAEGTNLVLIEPELANIFPDSIAVNAALRTLINLTKGLQKRRSRT